MTDASAPQNPQPQGTPPQAPAMRVLGQYIKDLSFENPGHGPVQAQPNIDLGIVTLANTVDTGGTSATHNIAINTESGYLY